MARLISIITALMLSAICAFSAAAQQYKEHIIQRGETMAIIAKRYGMSESALKAANPKVKTCYAGLKLRVPTALVTTQSTKIVAEEPSKGGGDGKSFKDRLNGVGSGIGKAASAVGEFSLEAAVVLSDAEILDHLGLTGYAISAVAEVIVNYNESKAAQSAGQKNKDNSIKKLSKELANSIDNPYNISLKEVDRRIDVLSSKLKELEDLRNGAQKVASGETLDAQQLARQISVVDKELKNLKSAKKSILKFFGVNS